MKPGVCKPCALQQPGLSHSLPETLVHARGGQRLTDVFPYHLPLFKFHFYLCVWCVLACVYVHHVYAVPVGARRGHQTPVELESQVVSLCVDAGN